jgi:hypothetical protein
VVFDLPQVIAVTEQIIQEAGLSNRITCVGGDLRVDAWPPGADLILLSSIVSCYEPQTVQALLAHAQVYLPSSDHLLLHVLVPILPSGHILSHFPSLCVTCHYKLINLLDLSVYSVAISFLDTL